MKNNKGFTLLEILLVVAAIAILAGIVIVAINPSKQLGDTRNAQRTSDVNAILNAVYQYSIDNDGTLPGDITSSSKEICTSTTSDAACGDTLVYLGDLVVAEKYLVALPVDPGGVCHEKGICYEINTTTNGRVVVTAPDAEQGATIQVQR